MTMLARAEPCSRLFPQLFLDYCSTVARLFLDYFSTISSTFAKPPLDGHRHTVNDKVSLPINRQAVHHQCGGL